MIKDASILITGANGGIGLETVKLLVKQGAGRIALACRTVEKARKAIAEIADPGTTELEPYGGFDMNDDTSINVAVRSLPASKPFDIVFLQSGGMIVSQDFQFIYGAGKPIEKTIYQNVFGAYLTVKALKKEGLLAPQARIVFAGGEGARGVKGLIEKPVFRSVDEFNSYIFKGGDKYADINALGVSKFMSALLVQKLSLVDTEHTYVWFSPGLTAGTNGLAQVPQPKRFVMENIGFPLMQSLGFAQGPKQAAQKFVDCLDGQYGESGDLIGAPEGKALGALVDQKPMNEGLTNHQFRDTFWEIVTSKCGTL
ncbi:SDR family NAD(P)-dependent oxidoreductase [bacterium SCSIO 12741]|nr:SDR family NAD(P)-dependent oxidoreductase [bacterium SCSIO 12741]